MGFNGSINHYYWSIYMDPFLDYALKIGQIMSVEDLPSQCMTDGSICGGFLMPDAYCLLTGEIGCLLMEASCD